MNLPTFRQIECMVAVAAKLNFRQAADTCHITQPALSAQIQQLEAVLGLKLFERDKRRVLPTAAGAALVEKAQAIMADLREFAEAGTAFKEPLSGTLRLGIIPTVAPYVLPRAMREVRSSHPKLRLLLKEGQTAELVQLLSEGSLDILLLGLEAELGDCETRTLFRDPFMLTVQNSHPMAARKRAKEDDLCDEQVLLLEDGHCLRDQILPLCERMGANELGDFRASSLTTLVQMVAGGMGITLLPEMSVRAEAGPERKLKVIPFGAKGPARTIGLAWRPSSIRKAEFQLLGKTIQRGLGR